MADGCLNTIKLGQTMAVFKTIETIILNINMVHLCRSSMFSHWASNPTPGKSWIAFKKTLFVWQIHTYLKFLRNILKFTYK